ncbi:MAG: hypothetical protein WB760_02540 [Xanthobacteraceae bacterium]
MTDNGHDITMPARLGTQNAEAVLGVVVGDALDEARKDFLRLILGPVFHEGCTHAILLKPATGRQRWSRDLASRLNLFQRNQDGAVCSNVALAATAGAIVTAYLRGGVDEILNIAAGVQQQVLARRSFAVGVLGGVFLVAIIAMQRAQRIAD